MKKIAILLNIILIGFSLYLIISEGVPENNFILIWIIIFLFPIINIFALTLAKNISRLKKIAILSTIILLGILLYSSYTEGLPGSNELTSWIFVLILFLCPIINMLALQPKIILEELSNFIYRLNNSQRIIIAIIIPLIIIMITITIGNNIFDESSSSCDSYRLFNREVNMQLGIKPCNINAFDFEYTWLLWCISLLIIGIFEYKLFANKEKNGI